MLRDEVSRVGLQCCMTTRSCEEYKDLLCLRFQTKKSEIYSPCRYSTSAESVHGSKSLTDTVHSFAIKSWSAFALHSMSIHRCGALPRGHDYRSAARKNLATLAATGHRPKNPRSKFESLVHAGDGSASS